MKYLSYIVCILILAGSLSAQDGTRLDRHRLTDQQYDQDDASRTNRKRMIADVDSTGIKISAWNDECWLKVKFFQRSDIDFFERGQRNGHPYVKYGTDNYRVRIYINTSGSLEFDWILRRRPGNGRHEFAIPIETQGLRFTYQPPLRDDTVQYDTVLRIVQADPLVIDTSYESHHRPDSVVGSYSIYHETGKHNRTYADGSSDNYQTGKLGHIFRPTVIDDDGNRLWGAVRITDALDSLILSVDSAWLYDPVRPFPVVIDPIVGDSSAGATVYTTSAYALGFKQGYGAYTAVSGDAVTSYHVYAGTSTASRMMTVYDTLGGVEGEPTNRTFDTTLVTIAADQWNSSATVSQALVAGVVYTVAVAGGGSFNYLYDDNITTIVSRDPPAGSMPDPWGTGNSHRVYEISMYATITNGVPPVAEYSRRRTLLIKD